MRNHKWRRCGRYVAAVLGIAAFTVCLPAVRAKAAVTSDWSEPVLLDKGDLNGDGRYTVRDALRALQINAGLYEADEQTKERADVNADGMVSADDALLLLKAAVGEYSNFGYEKPQEERVIYVDSKSYTTGTYCFRTLEEAVDYVNQHAPTCEEERITLRFASGTYREHTTLTAPYVTYEAMYPDAEEEANLTFYYGCGMYYWSISDGNVSASSNHASTVIASTAHDFIAKNMMIENSYNIYVTEEEREDYRKYARGEDGNWYGNALTIEQREKDIRSSKNQTQGLALRVDADRSAFYECKMIGRQDTLLMNQSNRVYYENCYIEGTVDFIYGNGTAVFESCTINSPYNAGHITAASTAETQPYGFLFKDCMLTCDPTTESSAPKEESYSLGRPWNGPAMVVFYNCRMDKHISNKDTPNFDRFVQMGGNGFLPENARYAEYGTMDMEGNLIDLEAVAPSYEKLLTDQEIQTSYAPYAFLAAKYNPSTRQLDEPDGWNPGNYPVVPLVLPGEG
ncbi:MAG: pectinesterase family protein [Lachnospiraceae bacterium]